MNLLAIVLSVGLVVDDAIVVLENVEWHMRLGRPRIEAAQAATHGLLGPIIAMTITLTTVYTPIGFQGELTSSLFLEFAFMLAVAVVLSGIVAITLLTVMSSRFMHPEGRLVERLRQPTVRRGACLCMTARACAGDALGHCESGSSDHGYRLAAVPFSQQELAPVEDQNHISLFFETSPDSTVAATNRQHSQIVKAITAIPETDYTWSLTTA